MVANSGRITVNTEVSGRNVSMADNTLITRTGQEKMGVTGGVLCVLCRPQSCGRILDVLSATRKFHRGRIRYFRIGDQTPGIPESSPARSLALAEFL